MTVPAQSNYFAVIKVVGVGGGGVNAVNRMIESGLRGVEFIATNTDAQALLMSDADLKLDIGRQLTRGLGAGSDPEVGPPGRRGAPLRDRGGPEGRRHGVHHRRQGRWHRHRAAPVVAEIAKSLGALTIGVVTRPFTFEGRRRSVQAEQGIQNLKEKVDTLIIIPNDRLLTVSNEKTSMVNAFKMADEVLMQGVQGITSLITIPGLINTDFADVKMIMSNAGTAIMGIGSATGEGRAVNAARAAITSPLLEASIEGARGILLNIAGGPDLGLFEVNEAAEIIHGVAHPDANIIFGSVIDEAMGEEVRVTVIAAGFERWEAQAPARSRHRRPESTGRDEARSRVLGADPPTRTSSPPRPTTTSTWATTTSTSPRSCAEPAVAPPAGAAPSPAGTGPRRLVATPRRGDLRPTGAARRTAGRWPLRRGGWRRPPLPGRRVAVGHPGPRADGAGVTSRGRRWPPAPDGGDRRPSGTATPWWPTTPGVALCVLTADCAPMALASPEGVFGAVHAGWRGLVAGVVEAAVGRHADAGGERGGRLARPVHPRRVLRVRRGRPRRGGRRYGDAGPGPHAGGRPGPRPAGGRGRRPGRAGARPVDGVDVCTACGGG